jgi:hypothetical protein
MMPGKKETAMRRDQPLLEGLFLFYVKKALPLSLTAMPPAPLRGNVEGGARVRSYNLDKSGLAPGVKECKENGRKINLHSDCD